MGYKVDDGQVIAMSRVHPNRTIAKRLGISARQVGRILKKHGIKKKRRRHLDRDDETMMMQVYRAAFNESFDQIGYRFGLSRQAVHQRLDN